jgi:hypothetical protein
LATDFSKVTSKLASAFSKVAGERPPTFLKMLANWLALFLKSQANQHKCALLQRLQKSRWPFSSDFRKITGSVPATVENALAKLARDFSELSANSKAMARCKLKHWKQI